MECQTEAYSINTVPHTVLLSNTSLISFVFTRMLQADRLLSGSLLQKKLCPCLTNWRQEEALENFSIFHCQSSQHCACPAPLWASSFYIHISILLYTHNIMGTNVCVSLKIIEKPALLIWGDSEGASLSRNSKVQYIYHKAYCFQMTNQHLMRTQRCCQPNQNCLSLRNQQLIILIRPSGLYW